MTKTPTPNLALKVAIVQSGKKQRAIARSTRIPETRLSHIVRGRLEPTEKERAVIARVLDRTEAELFGEAVMEQAAS